MKKSKTSNLIFATFDELIKLGYKKSTPEYSKAKYENVKSINPPKPGDLLCLLNTTKDLWAELDQKGIKHSKVNCEKFLIMEK